MGLLACYISYMIRYTPEVIGYMVSYTPEVVACVIHDLSQGDGVAAAGAGLSDVGAVLGDLPRHCGCHGGQNDGRCNVPGYESVGNVWCSALECANACRPKCILLLLFVV